MIRPLRPALLRLAPLRTASGLVAALVLAAALAPGAAAQSRDDLPDFLFNPAYYSSRAFEKKALMDGNEVAITFFNYGLLGGVGEVRGNWPKGSQDFYVGDVLPIIAAEVPVRVNGERQLVRHVLTTRGPGNRGIPSAPGRPSEAWTFEAKPGFASTRNRTDTNQPNDRVALSTDPQSWPDFWPDQPTWIDPTTGRAQWNGFFGRNQFNADLETYFWADDNNDRRLQELYGFRPDSTRPDRGGMGLELKVRALQWSQFLAQDAIFWLYEVTNSSTTTYDRVAVGLTVGTLSGGDGDSEDDLAFFDQANRIVYSWDFDNRGNRGQPVGYVGYGFLESPGNPFNGIDDDGDGDPLQPAGRDIDGRPFVPLALAGEGNIFTAADFAPRVLAAGDPLVLIDPVTFQRSYAYVPADGSPITVQSQGRTYTVRAGDVLQETQIPIQGQNPNLPPVIVTEKNGIDENLNGLIDEDITLHFERRAQAFTGEVITLPALRYRNYVGFARDVRGRTPTRADSARHGLLNLMIDESPFDGIDNDGDWDPTRDDVGTDGVPGTGAPGEGNGRPDQGEPNFGLLDVNETDQVGLTSFFYFAPSNAFPLNNPSRVWEGMTPGFFTTNEELDAQQSAGGIDGDFVFGSGYFRLAPGETLRFTLALVFGQDLQDITNNTRTIQEIYDRNYQFARPPDRPTLRAVPGDGRVTLYWDARAELSRDPILGDDFEGYRIYKSTDPFFRDAQFVTDVNGNPAFRVPIAQFDRINGVRGVYVSADPRTRGVPFNLGDDTGLRYSFVDTDVRNGQRYYYAVTAYDRGSPDFYPAENDIPVSVREDGTVVTGSNVVEVIPNAPVAGFRAGRIESLQQTAGGATGQVFTEALDPRLFQQGTVYTVRFDDDLVAADSFFLFRGDQQVGAAALSQASSVIVDGLRLAFNNDVARIDRDASRYLTGSGLAPASVQVANVPVWQLSGRVLPFDYEIRFGEALDSPSLGGFRLGSTGPQAVSRQTNVTVFNRTLNRPTRFVFLANDGNDGRFSASPAVGNAPARSDAVIIYECLRAADDCAPNELVPSYLYRIENNPNGTISGRIPGPGDAYLIATRKPFSRRDVYTFSTAQAQVDEDAARAQMDRIRVVPNPYVAAASWERPLPPTVTSGRGERRIDFIHLPAEAVVRIYNVRGALIRELRHDGGIDDGTVSWDLRTRENLEAAYGVYFYHVEAPGMPTRTGRLALIK
ncbi:MAG: hypothetical protein ACK41D_01370 [Rubricoccaceae bacterium]